MANTVNITNTNNTVTITPQNSNTVNTNNTSTSVSVTQGTTSVVTVNTAGPRGIQGPVGESAAAATASLLTTASYSNPNLTFTKGDGSQFNVEIETTFNTSSLLTTSSFIAYTGSSDSIFAGTSSLATNANNVYIDWDTTDSFLRVPMFSGIADGYYSLKSSVNELTYYYRAGNPITGQSTSNDYLYIGGGQNTAGGIFLNSTVSVNNFIYSNYGTLYIQADDQYSSNNALYPAALEITTYTGSAAVGSGSNYLKLLSTDIILENGVSGSTQITGSINLTGNLTASGHISASTYYGDGSNLTGIESVDINYLNTFTGSIQTEVNSLTAATSSYLTTVDISDNTNLTGGTNLTLSGDTINLDANISLTSITASGNISASAYYGNGSTLDNVVGLPHSGSLITSGGMVTLNTADYSLRDSGQVGGYRIKTREGIYVGVNGDDASAFGMHYAHNMIKYNNGYGRPSLTFGNSNLAFSHATSAPTFNGSNGLTVGGGLGKEIGVTGGNDLNVTFTGQFGAALTSGQSYMTLHGPNHSSNAGRLILAAGNNSTKSHIQFYTTGSERMRITHSGSVGIGTTDPQALLHVEGNISSSNTIYSKTGSFSHLEGNSPITVKDIITFQGAITASNISSSGDIFGSSIVLSGGTFTSSSLAAAIGGGGDNLGNHTADTNLNMSGYNITNIGNVDGVDVSTLKSDFDTLEGKTLFSSSAQVSFNSIINIPSGLVSSSDQILPIATSSITNFDTEVSRSVAEAGFGSGGDTIPNGTISSSAQVVASLPSGVVSGSSQILPIATSSITNFPTEVSRSAAASGFGASSGGTITALNNQAENRLVTIGATTTELDGEANLTYVGSTLKNSGVISASVFSGDGSGLTGISGNPFPFTGSAAISGSLTITGPINATQDFEIQGTLTASAISTPDLNVAGGGVPTINSDSNLILSASNAVVVRHVLRLTPTTTGSITAQNGDIVYDSNDNKFYGYANGAWVAFH